MRLIKHALAVAIVQFFPYSITASAAERYGGWWVVLATYPKDPADRMTLDVRRVETRAQRCGIKFFNDFSGKFSGFAEGYVVFVQAGDPHKDRASALTALQPVKRCFADAFIKQGRYLGE